MIGPDLGWKITQYMYQQLPEQQSGGGCSVI
jgi:hypothetical protein